MIIDFDDINSYPSEIIKYAEQCDYNNYNMVDFDVDYPIFFEDILNDYKFIVYHCTRTLNINNFKNNGILIPSNDKLQRILYSDCNGCNIADLGELSLGRGLDIQFVFSLDEIRNDKQYLNFFNHIGGEIIEFTEKYNEKKLKNGNCYIIKFLINGSEINYKTWLIQKMIRKIKYDIPVDFSGSITHQVKPTQIIDYILADEIYDKLKEMI